MTCRYVSLPLKYHRNLFVCRKALCPWAIQAFKLECTDQQDWSHRCVRRQTVEQRRVGLIHGVRESASGGDCITSHVQSGLSNHVLPIFNWRLATRFSGNFLIENFENFHPVFGVYLTEHGVSTGDCSCLRGWTCSPLFFSLFEQEASLCERVVCSLQTTDELRVVQRLDDIVQMALVTPCALGRQHAPSNVEGGDGPFNEDVGSQSLRWRAKRSKVSRAHREHFATSAPKVHAEPLSNRDAIDPLAARGLLAQVLHVVRDALGCRLGSALALQLTWRPLSQTTALSVSRYRHEPCLLRTAG